MIKRILSAPAHRFLLCAGCGRAPRHVASYGRAASEPTMVPGENTERHRLECPPCARSTGRHLTIDAAEREWGEKWAQLPLSLPALSRKEAA
jgi:hypothetical protein